MKMGTTTPLLVKNPMSQMENGELSVLEGRVTPSGRLKRIEEFLGMPNNVKGDKK